MMKKLNINNKLETNRLELIPLTYQQLLKYGKLDESLESDLGVNPRKRELTKDFKTTIEQYLIPYINLNPACILFATIWVMVLKTENVFIGDIGFNAAPSEKGVIEIGYSTYPEYMNQGYMTEAIYAMASWAFKQPAVHIIIAQTNKDNFASHKVLSHNKFSPFAEADTYYWWRLDREETVKDS